MNFSVYHCEIEKKDILKDIFQRIKKFLGNDFCPIFEVAEKLAKDKLRSIGLDVPLFLSNEELEIFINEKDKYALGFRIVPTPSPLLDIIEFSVEKKDRKVQELLENLMGTKIKKGSFIENILLERVQRRLGKLSPNGKKLADTSIRNKIRRLYDDNIRSKITKIIYTYGENVVPLQAIKESLKTRMNETKRFCDDPELFEKKYVIVCKECGTSYLAFSTKEKAHNALTDSNNYCTFCEKENVLDIVEGYRVVEALRLGIDQGLWLESLVGDIISEFTSHVWIGQIVDTNELDVLSIFCDKVVLVECKDTSFGQNDFYVTAMKAQDIQADVVLIVVTRDIHPNVKRNIERYKREGERSFETIIGNSAEKIKELLKTTLITIQDKYIKEWLSGESERYVISPRISRILRRFVR